MLSVNSLLLTFFVSAIAIVVGCSKSSLQSGSTYNTLSSTEYYYNKSMTYRVYNVTSTRDRFVTELVATDGKLIAPQNLTKGDFGIRTDATLPQALDLVVRSYAPSHPSGDFYFESLVLAPEIKLSNVTTALSWYLRFSVTPEPAISATTFERLSTTVEVLCSNCRNRTNSDVLKLILSNEEILSSVKKFVQADNPLVPLQFNSWNSPGPLYAWSSPNLTIDGVAAKTSKETESVSVKLILVNPDNSATMIKPSSWIHENPTNAVSVISTSDLALSFSYDDRGLHKYTALIDEVATDFKVQFNVDNTNRNPLCDTPLTITVYANRLSSAELTDYCRDPDLDASSISFTLSSGPVNFSISDIGKILWVPPQAADRQNYQTSAKFVVADAERGFFETDVNILVVKDQMPTFTSVPSDLSAVEGQAKIYTFAVTDLESDKVVMSVRGLQAVEISNPAGAGDLTKINSVQSGNVTTLTFEFTPSYLQAIGSDDTLDLKFEIRYDGSDGVLNGSILLNSIDLTLSIANTDDPPQWQSTPPDLVLVEGQPISAIDLSSALDPAPRPTTMTYSIESTGGVFCDHPNLSVAESGGIVQLNGSLSYASYSLCAFTIKATDAFGLTTASEPFNIDITDSNRPITTVPGAPTLFSDIFERKLYQFPISSMFQDPDDTDGDPYEEYAPDCHYFSDSSYSVDLGKCSQLGVPLIMGKSNLYLAINSSSTSAGTYYAEISFTDKGGVTATHRFTMVINQTAAPMDLDTVVDGTVGSLITVNENSSKNFILRAAASSVDAIDSYDFVVGTPSCSKIGGGLCPAGLLTALGSLSGTGTTDLNFRVSPDFTAGNVPLPDEKVSYLVMFTLQKSDDPTLRTDANFQIDVVNTNRAPTAIGVTAPSFGCTGDSTNSDTGKFQICIDLSKDKKSGSNWQKTYNVTTNVVDADTTNDSYTYSLAVETSPGSFTNNVWSFKIPGCFNTGSSTVYRTYDIKVDDGRGGTVTRPIELKIIRASAAANCM